MSSPLTLSWALIPRAALLAATLLGTACQAPAQASEPAARKAHVEGKACGGLAGFPCPEGYTCVDDPRDDCDPTQHGADCIGLCVKQQPTPPSCTGQEPQRSYISHDAEQCAAIRFSCESGKRPFFDECGCGCEPES